jgi:hypothetical protein
MTTSVYLKSNLFARTVTAFAILGPILLVAVAGTLPVGERGELIVNGHTFIVSALAAVLGLRAVYGLGFARARKLFVSSPHRSLTA